VLVPRAVLKEVCSILRHASATAKGIERLRDALQKKGAKLTRLFEQWDVDCDNAISRQEFRDAVVKVGIGVPTEQIDACFDKFDTDGACARQRRGSVKWRARAERPRFRTEPLVCTRLLPHPAAAHARLLHMPGCFARLPHRAARAARCADTARSATCLPHVSMVVAVLGCVRAQPTG
jgi:hypothetical protein